MFFPAVDWIKEIRVEKFIAKGTDFSNFGLIVQLGEL